ncbi:hypothetical protein ACR2WS_26515, partial [Klebsiella pneumoniae]
MIHIFVKEDYNKETLRSLLEYINDTVGRELTHGSNTDYDKDLVIETDAPIDEEGRIELAGTNTLKDDV